MFMRLRFPAKKTSSDLPNGARWGVGPSPGLWQLHTGISEGRMPSPARPRLPAGQPGAGPGRLSRVAFGASTVPRVASGRVRTRVNSGAGPERPQSPRWLVQGAGPQALRFPTWGPGLSCRLATPRPAPWTAAGACPQHGLARLACVVAVGRQLRVAAPSLRPALEPPQLPSAADPPRPVHGA